MDSLKGQQTEVCESFLVRNDGGLLRSLSRASESTTERGVKVLGCLSKWKLGWDRDLGGINTLSARPDNVFSYKFYMQRTSHHTFRDPTI